MQTTSPSSPANPFRPSADAAPAARTGKIARLPAALRDQVNRRLDDNQSAPALLNWLNALPETRQVLAQHFAGADVTPQNLSEWRQGGFREWLLRQEILDHAASLSQTADAVGQAAARWGEAPAEPSLSTLADDLATVLAARYAALLNTWDGEVTPEFEAKLQVLHRLTQDVAQLQKSLHRAADRRHAQVQAQKQAQKEELEATRRAAKDELKRPFRESCFERFHGAAAAAIVSVEDARTIGQIQDALALFQSAQIRPNPTISTPVPIEPTQPATPA